jgi:hypothetical protein
MPIDHKQVIIGEIKKHGGVSVFWATHTQRRAAAMDALIKGGTIVRQDDDPRDRYPWMVYTVKEQD